MYVKEDFIRSTPHSLPVSSTRKPGCGIRFYSQGELQCDTGQIQAEPESPVLAHPYSVDRAHSSERLPLFCVIWSAERTFLSRNPSEKIQDKTRPERTLQSLKNTDTHSNLGSLSHTWKKKNQFLKCPMFWYPMLASTFYQPCQGSASPGWQLIL
jgi:hypothetical protein